MSENCGNCYCSSEDILATGRIYYCRVKGRILESLNGCCKDHTPEINDPTLPNIDNFIPRKVEIVQQIKDLLEELETLQ